MKINVLALLALATATMSGAPCATATQEQDIATAPGRCEVGIVNFSNFAYFGGLGVNLASSVSVTPATGFVFSDAASELQFSAAWIVDGMTQVDGEDIFYSATATSTFFLNGHRSKITANAENGDATSRNSADHAPELITSGRLEVGSAFSEQLFDSPPPTTTADEALILSRDSGPVTQSSVTNLFFGAGLIAVSFMVSRRTRRA